MLLPSPKSQDHDVGVLAEVSVNCTVSGAVPVRGVAVKSAIGSGSSVDKIETSSIFAQAPYHTVATIKEISCDPSNQFISCVIFNQWLFRQSSEDTSVLLIFTENVPGG